MVPRVLAMVLFLALLPIGAADGGAEDETWSFDVRVGCQVGMLSGALLVPCGPESAPSDNLVLFTVEPGIHALEVAPTWSSEVSWGLDNIQVVLSHRGPCALPNCYSESGMTWRTVGEVTLAPGETAHFDDGMLSSSTWRFAGVSEATELRLSFVMGHDDHEFSGVYLGTDAEGTVTERYA